MRIIKNSSFLWSNSILLGRFLNKKTLRFQYFSQEGSKHHLYFDEQVQSLLKRLTGRDLDKIFRKRREGKKLKTPEYRFMSDEELKEEIKNAEKRADEKLQMPPVLPPRQEINHVFVQDDKLKGYSTSKHVFTDISFGKNDRNRVIVVREPDGTLRKATWEERNRMNEIYFPVAGRKLWMPLMFKEEYLKDLLSQKEYLFILDRACLQFEPDDPDYLRVTEQVYSHINEEYEFNMVRSTRHYGSLIFTLVLNCNIDNLLIENLQTDRLKEAVWAIQLYYIVNSDKHCKVKYVEGEELTYLKAFIEECSSSNGKLELAYNKYKDVLISPKVQAVV